jgi:hypothetical protein
VTLQPEGVEADNVATLGTMAATPELETLDYLGTLSALQAFVGETVRVSAAMREKALSPVD